MTNNDDFYTQLPDPTRGEAQGERLPFPALNLWWQNGNAQLKNLGGCQYYGGWQGEQKQLEGQDWTLSKSWERYDFTTRDGKTIPSVGNRIVTVGLIANRTRYTRGQDIHDVRLTWEQGYSSHTQWLGAMFSNTAMTDIIPVVLTVKGTQAGNMFKAVKAWQEALATANKAWSNYAISAFALSFGTTGDERKARMVGKTGSQSPIVPIEACIANVEKRLISRETIERMLDLRTQAKAWLDDWRNQYGRQATTITPNDQIERESVESDAF